MTKSKKRDERLESRFRDLPAWLALVMLAGGVWAVYGRSLDAPFIFDDSVSVLANRSIEQLWPLVGGADRPGPLNPPKEIPTSGRPLVNLSFAVNYHFGQHSPRGYRAFNILLHVLSAMLLWAIVRRTLRLSYFGGQFDRSAGWLALATALLWAMHPLVTETVVYVTQRTELMVALFYLATLYGSLRYWDAKSPSARSLWLALATLACLAGAASKEVIVSAPLVVLLFERTFVSGTFGEALRRSWPLYVGLAASWMLILAIQLGTPRSESAGFGLGLSLFDWWCTQAEIFVTYLKLAVWPSPLLIHYELPHLETFGTAWPYVLVVAVLGCVTLVLVWRRRAAGFLAACVFMILAPTHVVPITTEIAAERRMYLPLMALVALATIGGYSLAERFGRRAIDPKGNAVRTRWPYALASVAVLLLFVAYGIASVRRLAVFDDPVALWQENVALQPHNHVAHTNLAVLLSAAGRSDQAIEHYRAALRFKPGFEEARYNLGLALAAGGQFDAAIEQLQELVRQKPDAYRIRNNLGVVLFTAGRLPEAIAEFEKTLDLRPDFLEAEENLNRARRQRVLLKKPQ